MKEIIRIIVIIWFIVLIIAIGFSIATSFEGVEYSWLIWLGVFLFFLWSMNFYIFKPYTKHKSKY